MGWKGWDNEKLNASPNDGETNRHIHKDRWKFRSNDKCSWLRKDETRSHVGENKCEWFLS